MPIEFLELAVQELNEAYSYYEEQQANLGNRFKQEIYNSLHRIAQSPKIYQKIQYDVRRCIVHKFPFNILFSIETDHLLVIAIAHHHREPDYWIDRV
ncbi:MAG: type II toxin-antitoxin system RelE/ParE family toxin [Campylobacterales bacterium]|nr:type II toxin-antitoxin system RelE/ParE family toxin [Campylobacterales bacterium]